MGSSTKRKKEKKSDFQKTKLKVGKTKAKPDNFTDTSFRAKTITLNQQSLHITAPSADAQFTHHVSLLSSKSDTQRRDSLAHLTTSFVSRPPVSVLLPTLLPLILDASSSVRAQLLKLLRALPANDIQDHVPQLLPYIRAGMTHLAADIRVSAVEVLAWLVDVAGAEVVSCAGGWIKTLNCFLSVLGWHTEESSKWSGSRASFGKSGAKGQPMVKVLAALAVFLQAGIGRPDDMMDSSDEDSAMGVPGWEFPLCHAALHMLPQATAPFVHLNLFGQPRDEEGEMYETREDRYRVFENRFLGAVQRGLEGARSEGGEVGRASAGVSKVLKEAIAYGPGA
ncbi:IPI1/TEX10 family protein [Aspergillus novofumigatus IBT 16806]|uniref:Pre-rRNA-processing protein n=1 Tax=Aspergillus novofumigatus (strain IBT 16806) TaxID=1392255 RepID=A0A2I1CEX8_ASPN1|nr:putative rRNA processing protein Ipi1 [Aspergillus novofumigatus IBT 16806]PKX96148.1 putative rRNA processing protein Ipi1 [Aspergillus novofumigatus IBT 16806]